MPTGSPPACRCASSATAASIFETDPHTKNEFYWLANQGVPIRLRFNPTWFPEINHWKMALFVGQSIVEFGSGNFAPTELAPVSSTNYDDETELFTDDPALVDAFKTKFDVMWNDTTLEPQSIIGQPPYFKDWNDACANEPTGNCADYHTLYPNPAPMIINTARLEGDNPMPPDLIWGQGPDFNNRLVQEINNEFSRIDFDRLPARGRQHHQRDPREVQRRRAGAPHRRPGPVHQHHLAGVLADAREHRQAVGGRRADQAGACTRASRT